MPFNFGPYFPFRRDNRKPDGTWDAPDATGDNIKGTSVDPYDPVWPRWKQKPPPHGEGDFTSDDPFFDIDDVTQRAEYYPPGRPLVDKNVDGNPASRQRVGDMPAGNLWRRRLLVGHLAEAYGMPAPGQHGAAFRSASNHSTDRTRQPPVSDPWRSKSEQTMDDRARDVSLRSRRLPPPSSADVLRPGSIGSTPPSRGPNPAAADIVKNGLFANADATVKSTGGEQSTADWISARNESKQKAQPLPGYKVQAIPQPSNDGFAFSIRLGRGQPQTNLGGALVGHIRREGGYYDPNGVYYRLEDHEDRFGPTEFDEIVDFVSKGKQEGDTKIKDKWAFAKLPPGWRSDVTVTATWTYVDKLTKEAAQEERLGFMENRNFSGTFLSKKGTTDWAALGFRQSAPTEPVVRKIPSQ